MDQHLLEISTGLFSDSRPATIHHIFSIDADNDIQDASSRLAPTSSKAETDLVNCL